jgi:molybdopterin-guanine dinucleotide biosynthesis protein A
MTVVGVLVAGGRGRRMGGADKSLILLGGKTLIAHAAERLGPQVDRLIVNANGDPSRFAALALPVVADYDDAYSGPLAGILAGMEWARGNLPDAGWIATVAADTPFVPPDLVVRLLGASNDGGTIRVAASNGKLHWVIGLWPVSVAGDIGQWLESGGSKAVRDFLADRPHVAVEFPAEGSLDPFFNINTPEDLARAEREAVGKGAD